MRKGLKVADLRSDGCEWRGQGRSAEVCGVGCCGCGARCDDRGRAGAGRRAWRAPASVVRRGSIGRTTYRTGTRRAGGTRMRWRIWHV